MTRQLDLIEDQTPTEFRQMLINGLADFDAKVKPESAEEVVDAMLASGKVRFPGGGNSLVPVNEPEPEEEETFWCIPPQAEIEISKLPGGAVRIHQVPGPGTQSEGETITVAQNNAVALARRILWAAGWQAVLIAAGSGGGYVDVNDGDIPGDFE